MANIKLLRGLSTSLGSAAKVDGQILFCTDTKEIHLDYTPSGGEVTRIRLYDGFDTRITALEALVSDGALAQAIKDAIDNLKKEVVLSVAAKDNSIVVDNADKTNPKVQVKLSTKSDNTLTLRADSGEEGLYVAPTTIPEYTIVKEQTAESGAAATYSLMKGSSKAGVSINIPKDMVVESGTVVKLTDGTDSNPQGLDDGTYIKLTLANATNTELYINVGTLVDIYTSGSQTGTDPVVITIDQNSRKITASITDGTITQAMLNETVQSKLSKAVTAVQSVTTGDTNGTIKVDNESVAVRGLDTAAYKKVEDFEAAGAVEDAIGELTHTNVGSAGSNKYVSAVTQADGKVTVTYSTLPDV